jgi:hypothetical protein
MPEQADPRTTRYGASTRESAFDAFSKVAVAGLVTLIALAAASSANAADPSATASARNAADVASISAHIKPVSLTSRTNRVFKLHSDAEGTYSLGSAEASSMEELLQPRLREDLKTNGGRNHIELSFPITSEYSSRLVTVLCPEVEKNSQASCLVLSVQDQIVTPEARDLFLSAGHPISVTHDTIRQTIDRLNLPSHSDAHRKAQVTSVTWNVLDPSLKELMDRYKTAPTAENLYGLAAGFEESIFKFIPGAQPTLSMRHENEETSTFETPDAQEDVSSPYLEARNEHMADQSRSGGNSSGGTSQSSGRLISPMTVPVLFLSQHNAAPVPKGGLGGTGRGRSGGS